METLGTISPILKAKGPNLWTISPHDTVYQAIQKMADQNIGALIVLQDNKVVGIVTERDYTRKVALKGKSSRQTLVQEIISIENTIAVTPEHTVEECMRLMTDHRVRHLPVIDGNTLVGIVSIGDLVNWTISAQSVAIDQLESYINGSYPG